jgi:hypothetical protein
MARHGLGLRFGGENARADAAALGGGSSSKLSLASAFFKMTALDVHWRVPAGSNLGRTAPGTERVRKFDCLIAAARFAANGCNSISPSARR